MESTYDGQRFLRFDVEALAGEAGPQRKSMTSTVYPNAVKCLAEDVDTYHGVRRQGSRRSHFSLNVAGPFNFWPKLSISHRNIRAALLADSASNLLGMDVRHGTQNGAVNIRVVVTDEIRQRLIEAEYQKSTASP